jgi:hypothetical protein
MLITHSHVVPLWMWMMAPYTRLEHLDPEKARLVVVLCQLTSLLFASLVPQLAPRLFIRNIRLIKDVMVSRQLHGSDTVQGNGDRWYNVDFLQ